MLKTQQKMILSCAAVILALGVAHAQTQTTVTTAVGQPFHLYFPAVSENLS